jgi:hypothetical protein
MSAVTKATEYRCAVRNCSETTDNPSVAGWFAFFHDGDDDEPGAVAVWCSVCYHDADLGELRGRRWVPAPDPDAPPVEKRAQPRVRSNTISLPTTGPFAACLYCGASDGIDDMTRVKSQGLLTIGGQDVSVRGLRCSECRKGLDYQADGDPLLLAALQIGCLVEQLPRFPLWCVYVADSQMQDLPAPPPDRPWSWPMGRRRVA